MPAKTETLTQSRGKRRPLYPYVPPRVQVTGQEDKTQALWPWYLKPFREPRVSPECRAYVMGEYQVEDEEERNILLSELAEAHTIQADANSAITQQPGAASSLRQDYYAQGFRAITPIMGEASGGTPLRMWEPQIHSGHQIGNNLTDPYVGIEDIIAELADRMKWSLAQLDAKIAMAQERVRDDKGESQRYQRAIVAALRRRRAAVENGLPTVKELQLFFKRFELQRLTSQQDQKMKEAITQQGRIDNANADIARLASEINQESVWPEGVPA